MTKSNSSIKVWQNLNRIEKLIDLNCWKIASDSDKYHYQASKSTELKNSNSRVWQNLNSRLNSAIVKISNLGNLVVQKHVLSIRDCQNLKSNNRISQKFYLSIWFWQNFISSIRFKLNSSIKVWKKIQDSASESEQKSQPNFRVLQKLIWIICLTNIKPKPQIYRVWK